MDVEWYKTTTNFTVTSHECHDVSSRCHSDFLFNIFLKLSTTNIQGAELLDLTNLWRILCSLLYYVIHIILTQADTPWQTTYIASKTLTFFVRKENRRPSPRLFCIACGLGCHSSLLFIPWFIHWNRNVIFYELFITGCCNGSCQDANLQWN